MKKIVIYWEGPFNPTDPIPNNLRGVPGIYLIECDSEILYIGKSEMNGAFKRAKDHFRDQGDTIGRWIIEQKDKSIISLWIGFTESNEDIFLIEKFLINHYQPSANLNYINRYNREKLEIINYSNHPNIIKERISNSCKMKVRF